MKGSKGITIVWGAVFLAIFAWAVPSLAEYPEKPVQLLIGYPPGGSSDASARALVEAVKPFFPMSIAVVNKPGGSGVLMTSELIQSAPNGYTLGQVSGSMLTIAPNLDSSLPYKGPQDLQFIISCARGQDGIAVRADSPWKTMKEMIDYAKANPGKVRVGCSGIGGSPHFSALSLYRGGIKEFTFVPFTGGGPAITALLGGHIEAVTNNTMPFLAHVQAGKLRLLALFAEERDTRVPELKDVPTFKELGYNVLTVGTPYYIVAPKKTPQKVVGMLYDAFLKAEKTDFYQNFCRNNLLLVEMKGPEMLAKETEKDYTYFRNFIDEMNLREMLKKK
jgi:tripartite-type tricarboxylate transporter receptor subunit TctC